MELHLKWLIAIALVSTSLFAKSHRRATVHKALPSRVHMTKVGTCEVEGPEKKVLVIKQWHLAPKTATHGFKEKYPQEKNQTAIYQMLEEGVKRDELQLIVSEGCEGEINDDFKAVFNGWDLQSLKAEVGRKGYDKIITLVPLKIEAKYGAKVQTLCGDVETLIQEGNLRLSNLRGWMGFYTRLSENKNDGEKTKLFSESAADLLRIPRDTPPPQLMAQIRAKLKEELEAFRKSLDERDDAFVKVLSDHDFTKAAIVIGGLHAADLKTKLENAGLGCEILEPPGYQRDDEKLIEEFARAL